MVTINLQLIKLQPLNNHTKYRTTNNNDNTHHHHHHHEVDYLERHPVLRLRALRRQGQVVDVVEVDDLPHDLALFSICLVYASVDFVVFRFGNTNIYIYIYIYIYVEREREREREREMCSCTLVVCLFSYTTLLR